MKLINDLYDSWKIFRYKRPFIILINDSPMKRWEYKYQYIQYTKKFQRDREDEFHSTIWEPVSPIMLTFDSFKKQANEYPHGSRQYCSVMTSHMFMTHFGNYNISMNF